ncbi:MAG TPA: phospholipase D-like domain-containing protein [Methylomirabilota bacterium]
MSRRGAVVAGALLALLLTAGGCSSVPPHLELPALQMGDPSFRATLVAYTGNAVVSGNRVEVLLNGDQIFPAKIAAIRAARKSITYAQYVFEEGQPAIDTAQALAERCRAGVPVHVLLDAVGALAMPTQYLAWMTEAGCKVVFYHPLNPWSLDRVNERNHRRILVVDGTVGFTGGSGTSGKWSGNGREDGYWRDTDVRVQGPVVEQLQGAFVESWLEATGVALGGPAYFPRPIPVKGGVDAHVVRSSPAGGSAAMYTMFLLAMASARRSIYITNPYFVPDEKMVETLIQARQRGVRVVLLLPGAIDHNLVRQASRGGFGRLLKEGVEIHEYKPALLHAKTMVIDSMWSTVGSTNLDRRSFALNEELNLVIYDAGVAKRLEEVFEKDLSESTRVTYQRWANRGIVSRVLEWLAVPVRDQL